MATRALDPDPEPNAKRARLDPREEEPYRLEMQGELALPDPETLRDARSLLRRIRNSQEAMWQQRAELEQMRKKLLEAGEAYGKRAGEHTDLVARFERIVEERLRAEAYAGRPIDAIRQRNLCSDPTCRHAVAFVPENCPHGFCILHAQPYVFDPRTRLPRCMHCRKSLGPRRFEAELEDDLFGDAVRLAGEKGETFSYEHELGRFRAPLWLALLAPPHHPLHSALDGKFCRDCHEMLHAVAADVSESDEEEEGEA